MKLQEQIDGTDFYQYMTPILLLDDTLTRRPSLQTVEMQQHCKGPFRLVTVNTAPERAQRLIGRMIEGLEDRYEIQHIANVTSKYSSPSAYQCTLLIRLKLLKKSHQP